MLTLSQVTHNCRCLFLVYKVISEYMSTPSWNNISMQGPPLLAFLALLSIYTTGRRATPQELSVLSKNWDSTRLSD